MGTIDSFNAIHCFALMINKRRKFILVLISAFEWIYKPEALYKMGNGRELLCAVIFCSVMFRIKDFQTLSSVVAHCFWIVVFSYLVEYGFHSLK